MIFLGGGGGSENFFKKGWKFGVGAGLLKKEGGEVGVGD